MYFITKTKKRKEKKNPTSLEFNLEWSVAFSCHVSLVFNLEHSLSLPFRDSDISESHFKDRLFCDVLLISGLLFSNQNVHDIHLVKNSWEVTLCPSQYISREGTCCPLVITVGDVCFNGWVEVLSAWFLHCQVTIFSLLVIPVSCGEILFLNRDHFTSLFFQFRCLLFLFPNCSR